MAASAFFDAASLRRWGRELVRGLTDLLFPPACLLCDVPLAAFGSGFCKSCALDLMDDRHEACPRCAQTVGQYTASAEGCSWCRDQRFAFAAAIRLGSYESRRREAVLRIKQRGGDELAYYVARLWAERSLGRLRSCGAEVVVPVPLHWLRQLRRGHNQAAILAEGLARRLGLPVRPAWLTRRRATPHQTGQSAAVRRDNVAGAFVARRRPELNGRTVLLVDDVMTTGSTCHEAARALIAAGAARIVVAVLARSELG